MNKPELIAAFRRANIIYRDSVTLRAGEPSYYYADVKKALGDPRLLKMTAVAMAEIIDPNVTFIAASGYGGIPLGTAISLETGLPLSMVRDEEKKHGKPGMVHGYEPLAGDAAVIVDDVFSTGSSLLKTAGTLVGFTDVEIQGCGVVVARADTSNFAYPVTHLISVEDLMV